MTESTKDVLIAQQLANSVQAKKTWANIIVNAKEYGVVSDGVTDDTAKIHSALAQMQAPGVLYIPPNTVWDYNQVTHPNEIVIWDMSGYDWINTKKFSAMSKYISKTSDPGTKNANGFISTSPYHPYVGIHNTDPLGRASVVFIRGQDYEWGITTDTYTVGGVNYNIFQMRNAVNGIRAFISALGYPANNEMGFNYVPAVGISYIFGSRVVGDNVTQYYTEGPNQNITFSYNPGNVEKWRVIYRADGSILFNNRVDQTKNIIFTADGRIQYSHQQRNGTPVGVLNPGWIGEEVLDISVSPPKWYKSTGLTANDWVALN